MRSNCEVVLMVRTEGGHTNVGSGDNIGSKLLAGSYLSDVNMVLSDDTILITLIRGGPVELS